MYVSVFVFTVGPFAFWLYCWAEKLYSDFHIAPGLKAKTDKFLEFCWFGSGSVSQFLCWDSG